MEEADGENEGSGMLQGKERGVIMAGFTVGMNPYYQGLSHTFGNADRMGVPAQGGKIPGGKEAEQTDGSGFGDKQPGEKCETCEKRKYQDGSDENVSFKAEAHISPEAAAGQVRAHEGEHVANAYAKAEEKDGKVISVSVRLKTSVCPECGKNYVSGGTTSTRISYPSDSTGEKGKEAEPGSEGTMQKQANPYRQSQWQIRADAVRGKHIDYTAKPLEEFEMERY